MFPASGQTFRQKLQRTNRHEGRRKSGEKRWKISDETVVIRRRSNSRYVVARPSTGEAIGERHSRNKRYPPSFPRAIIDRGRRYFQRIRCVHCTCTTTTGPSLVCFAQLGYRSIQPTENQFGLVITIRADGEDIGDIVAFASSCHSLVYRSFVLHTFRRSYDALWLAKRDIAIERRFCSYHWKRPTKFSMVRFTIRRFHANSLAGKIARISLASL